MLREAKSVWELSSIFVGGSNKNSEACKQTNKNNKLCGMQINKGLEYNLFTCEII